ncbi:MAG: hypothetical protein AAF242_09290 [Bacteroidota bacterium]
MQKEEVELVIIGVKMGKEEALNMKIYKDGTLCRRGCGGLPEIGISGMTVQGPTTYWDTLFPLIDEQIIAQPIMHQDEQINTALEYFMAFYGVSSNGETGERAQWTKSSGVRFLLDSNTSFRHPLLGFLDGFVIKAAEVTNEWYFDIMMNGVYGLQALGLKDTLVSIPKTEAEQQEALGRYVNQMIHNGRPDWDIVKVGNGRKYKSKEGKELSASVVNKGGQVSINFYEAFGPNDTAAAEARLMEILNKTKGDGPNPDKKITDSNSNKKQGAKPWWQFWK